MSEEKQHKHTAEELLQWQALPLDVKILMTGARIRAWVNEYGESGVYVAFSGGKDSTVLSHLVDRFFPNNSIPRVFSNTGLEYPEVVSFVKRQGERVVMLKPKMNFKKVIEKYGYPFISKETAQTVYEGQKGQKHALDALRGEGRTAGGMYDRKKWGFFLQPDAPRLTHMCCHVMKKDPMDRYARETGRNPITGEMAQESLRRKTTWMKYGCNMYDKKQPKSTPMAFWTEQDVLKYIKENNLEIASVYGDVVPDVNGKDVADGQMRIENLGGGDCKLCTTGCSRTGCMFCGFGAHREKQGEGRFLKMRETHPKLYDWIMKPTEEGGLGYRSVIDWINENGNLHIEY